uniref:Uncharacterized protein n=1 Tax=Peronospora matthiolae TaxID=2874970 RepID=A0AAV1VAF4_9STRA
MHAVQRREPGDRKALAKARRCVGRINSSLEQQRHLFDADEKMCVERVMTAAKSKVPARYVENSLQRSGSPILPPDDADNGVTCLIPGARLIEFFTVFPVRCMLSNPWRLLGTVSWCLEPSSFGSKQHRVAIDAPCADEIEAQVQRFVEPQGPVWTVLGMTFTSCSYPSFCLQPMQHLQACAAEMEG